ncbi:MAG: hypothetical protein LBO03_00995 [Acidaminococcales bacterium]|jgi:hypothetical protein|nr:hypothetical protein [Acidaminococcales bacterium]
MSNHITKEKLAAGVVFGDTANNDYIYMPGGEIGCARPVCVMERGSAREELSMDEAAEKVMKLSLKPLNLPPFGKK